MSEVNTIAATPGFPVTLDRHTFRLAKSGDLEHLVDGELRAVIPPAGFADYLKDWPQAAGALGAEPGHVATHVGAEPAE